MRQDLEYTWMLGFHLWIGIGVDAIFIAIHGAPSPVAVVMKKIIASNHTPGDNLN